VVKENASQIRSTTVKPSYARSALTGGSTGEPLQTWNDARVPMLPLSWRMYGWWGTAPADNVVHVGRWGSSRRTRLTTFLSWWPTRVTLVDAGKLDERTIAGLVETVNRYRPPLVEGYGGALYEIARYVDRKGLEFHPPKALGATSAPLTPEVRAYVEATLGAPLHDQYRCSEVPWMAGECGRRDGLHIFSDMRRIEVVDEAGKPQPPGVVGDLVVTDLANRVFPLVRYRLGDRGSLREQSCQCGVSLPLMESLDGRAIDVIRLPDRTVVAGGIVGIFSAVPSAVRLFRMHQNADYSIDVQVVLGDSATAQVDAQTALAALRDRLERKVDVRLNVVDSLPYTGGKIKYITSDVLAPK
jgi:phenylacetate-CoA ligase